MQLRYTAITELKSASWRFYRRDDEQLPHTLKGHASVGACSWMQKLQSTSGIWM